MASDSQPSDAEIKAHVESVWEKKKPDSPIYVFLLSDIAITSATKGRVIARLELTKNHVNSKGGIHGTTSACIIDWIGGLAIASWDLRENSGVSTDIHVNYVGSARVGDTIEVDAKAQKVGGTLAFTTITISKVVDGKVGPVVATGSHTKFVKI